MSETTTEFTKSEDSFLRYLEPDCEEADRVWESPIQDSTHSDLGAFFKELEAEEEREQQNRSAIRTSHQEASQDGDVLENGVSDTIQSSTGAPQGIVLAPFVYTIYTADFKHNTSGCFLHRIFVFIKGGKYDKYRSVIRDFMDWINNNNLHFNTTKTKEMVASRPLR